MHSPPKSNPVFWVSVLKKSSCEQYNSIQFADWVKPNTKS